MTEPFVNWPHKWFGCWREFGAAYERCPSIEEFVDPGWNYPHRAEVAAYLVSSPVVATTSRLALPWAKGPGDGRSTVSYRSDGHWLWLDDLDYYITEQSVRLPDAFIAEIEAHGFTPPSDLTVSPGELPRPPVGS